MLGRSGEGARGWQEVIARISVELNRFAGPGPDLRPTSRHRPGEFVRSVLPDPFMRRIFGRLRALRSERKPHVVFRPE
jgi:hypothetical protein